MSAGRPWVTVLSPFVPHAAVADAGGRILHEYLVRLATTATVTVIVPGSEFNRQESEGEPVLPPAEIHLVPIRRRPRTALGYLPRLMANTAAGITPGWQVLRGFRADPWVWDRIASSDLVELQWPYYLPFVKDIRRLAPGVPIAAFEYDIQTVSLTRRSKEGRLHERTFGRVAAAVCRRREPALLNRCDAVFVLSTHDAEALRRFGVVRPIEVIDPPLNFAPLAPATEKEALVLFVGALNRPENHEGARWFVEEVWPAVEKSVPEARLVLAGASPPASLQRLGSGSVSVPGFVADLGDLYGRARVFVGPNLTGAGVKFKVLDALGHGLPVVATPVAAEGIADGLEHPGFAAITNDAREMAEAVVALLEDPEAAAALGAGGRAWVEERYRFGRSVDRILAIYGELIGRSKRSAS